MKGNNEFIPLYMDIMFKKFLGTNEYIYLTTYLLETLFNLPKGSLDGSEITNSVKLDKETIINKRFELDVILKTPNGDIYDIEMQNDYNENAEIKNVLYVAKVFSEELKIGEMYKEIKPVTLVNLVKKTNLHKNNKILNKYVFTNTEDKEDKILEKYLTIYIVNLDLESEVSYNVNKEFDIIRRFINSETLEEMRKVISESSSIISNKLLEEMLRYMNNEEVQDYSRQEKLIRSNINTAREEGFSEGFANGVTEGISEGEKNIAKNILKNSNMTLEEISLYTGLPVEELVKIKEEL